MELNTPEQPPTPLSRKIDAIDFLGEKFREIPQSDLEQFYKWLTAYRDEFPGTLAQSVYILNAINGLIQLKKTYENFATPKPLQGDLEGIRAGTETIRENPTPIPGAKVKRKPKQALRPASTKPHQVAPNTMEI